MSSIVPAKHQQGAIMSHDGSMTHASMGALPRRWCQRRPCACPCVVRPRVIEPLRATTVVPVEVPADGHATQTLNKVTVVVSCYSVRNSAMVLWFYVQTCVRWVGCGAHTTGTNINAYPSPISVSDHALHHCSMRDVMLITVSATRMSAHARTHV